jgi:hypothetical protein
MVGQLPRKGNDSNRRENERQTAGGTHQDQAEKFDGFHWMDFTGWISLDGFHWVGWLKETLQIKDAINGSSLVGKPWVPVYTTGILPRNRRKNRCDSASFP